MKKTFIKTVLNIVLYTAIGVMMYFLYSPLNPHPNNKTSSSITFVYQQF